MLFIFWGVLMFEVWPTISGMIIVYSGKVWFLDRMVWLWQDMKDVPDIRSLTVYPESTRG